MMEALVEMAIGAFGVAMAWWFIAVIYIAVWGGLRPFLVWRKRWFGY